MPNNYSPPIPIFIDDSIEDNRSKIHETITNNLSELLNVTQYNSNSFFMLSEEKIQGVIYIFHTYEIPLAKELQQSIEESLVEVYMMLEIISDWHLHQSLVKFNEIGLTLQGCLLSNFVEQMLAKARKFIGCSGLSFL